MNALLMQAKASPGMVMNAALLDADPYALCTPEGVVDLRTGALTPPDPATQHHSRSTTVAPQTMPTPRWQRFLDDTFGTDTEGRRTADFLHLLLGSSISGDVGAQVMPFLYGLGKNGKSVLLDVMLQLMGDYADAAPPGFLMAKVFEGHPTDLAELHGRRIIVCSELKPGDRFDEARVKLLTGGDKLTTRTRPARCSTNVASTAASPTRARRRLSRPASAGMSNAPTPGRTPSPGSPAATNGAPPSSTPSSTSPTPSSPYVA